MTPKNQTETFVYEAVKSGVMEVRADGSVWRLFEERGNRWNSNIKRIPVKPHRIDGIAPSGYRVVKVMRSRKQMSVVAHRLVWLHFKGPIPPGLTVNHKNGINSDNRPSNLELATYSEQINHARTVLGKASQQGHRNNHAKLNNAAIREIRRRRAAGESLKSIAKDFNISDRTVSRISRGESWAFLG